MLLYNPDESLRTLCFKKSLILSHSTRSSFTVHVALNLSYSAPHSPLGQVEQLSLTYTLCPTSRLDEIMSLLVEFMLYVSNHIIHM